MRMAMSGPAACAGGGAARAAPAARSPVSATMADLTPGTARTAASAALRTGSQAGTTAASTVIEKNTLPSLTTTSESLPVPVSGAPSGLFTAASAASTCSLVRHHIPLIRAGRAAPSDKPRASGQRLPRRLTECARFAQTQPTNSGRQGRSTMAKVAFLGLGVMGYPMAGHLKNKGGHEVTVYNRTAAKAEQWAKEFGGKVAKTPEEAAAGQDFVMMCVGNDNDVRAVAGAAFPEDGQEHGVRRSHHRLGRGRARALRRARRRAASISSTRRCRAARPARKNGVLTVMCGGDAEPYGRAEKVIAAYARMCKLLGPAGSGQLTKMVNQICIAGLVQGLSEGIHFAKKAGLDVEAVIETISKGAAQSWQMENRYKTMNAGKYDFGFAVDWMRKDLSICLAEARRSGAHLPVAALVDQFYSEVQKMGGGRWDTSSLMARLER